MKNIEIEINRETGEAVVPKREIGNDGENLQGNLIFSFVDTFVDGQGRLEYEIDGNKQYVKLKKENESYHIPIKSFLTKKGTIDMQLVITEGTDETEIPIFKSDMFYVTCKKSINAEIEQPDEYLSWIEVANTKLNEIDNLNIDIVTEDGVTKVIVTKKDGTVEETIVSTGGVLDYEFLQNLPSINGEVLKGNKTTEDLGILNDVKTYIDKNKEELRGEPGKDGVNGSDGITPTIGANGNWYLGNLDTGKPSRGANGIDGKNGLDGYTPIKGEDYFDGEPGKDGYTPQKGVDYFDGKPGEKGEPGEDGYTPIKGKDYYTEADKEEIVELVLESLPSSEEVSY